MSVLENFKNIHRSPYGGRQGSNVIFFSSNLQRSLWKKKREGPVAPPHGRQAPAARWGGDRVLCFSLANIEFHKIPPASEDLL